MMKNDLLGENGRMDKYMSSYLLLIYVKAILYTQNSECCNADFWPVRRVGLSWTVHVLQWINGSWSILMKVADIVYIYIMEIMWWDLKRILSSRLRDNCGGVFEQLARHTMRYQESDLHLAFILLNLLTTSTYSPTFSVLPTSPLFSTLVQV